MRSWIVGLAFAAACARDNPAFDAATRDVDGDATAVGTSELPPELTSGMTSDVTSGDDSGDTYATTQAVDPDTTGEPTTSGIPDACGATLTDGMELLFGDPRVIGACPTGVGIWARLDLVSQSDPVFVSCDAGCGACTTAHAFSVAPLDLAAALAVDASSCLRLETSVPLGESNGLCRWGAMTIHDPVGYAPYFAAITEGSEPTTTAAGYLGMAIPAPETAIDCTCARVDGDVCCPGAGNAVKFLGYPFDGTLVGPGDTAMLELAGPQGLALRFEPLQAQVIPTCDGSDVQTSWAVLAVP